MKDESMMSKKIWVVSELYYPEETSTGYFLTKIAEGLAESLPVSVLCVQPTYAARGVRAPVKERRNRVDIIRCKATALNKDIMIYRLVNMITISLSIFIKTLLHVNRQDYVLVVTNPPLLPFLTVAACRLRGAKCLLLVHDVYPEVLIVTGMTKAKTLFVKLLERATKLLYQNSERIIVLGRDMRELVLNKIGDKNSQRVVVIPNWADIDEIVPGARDESAFLAALGLSQKFVVQYSGNMGRTHGLENIIATANKLSPHENIHFLFRGTGAKKPWLESAVKKSNLANVSILPSQPRSELKSLLNGCDVAIISFIPGMAGISVPSRMYNILAAGKPIIAVADPESELALVVQEEKVGWVIPPNAPDILAEVILEAMANKELLIKMGYRARAVAEEKYSLNRIIKKYTSLVNGIG